MSKQRLSALALIAVSLVLALTAAGCGGDDEPTSGEEPGVTSTDGEPAEGGTYRLQTTQFNHTGGFDPTGEYLGTDLSLTTIHNSPADSSNYPNHTVLFIHTSLSMTLACPLLSLARPRPRCRRLWR